MASTLIFETDERRLAFSIEQILGLELERPGSCVKLHRPWTEMGAEKMNTGNSLCCKQQHCHHHHHLHPQQLNAPLPSSTWYTGRRPRTTFTNSQLKVLGAVFQVNWYPGIQLREQLSKRLDLDEDRIQIWFQNRRAKLRRCFRESHLLQIQADLCVRHRAVRLLEAGQDEGGGRGRRV